MPDRAERRLTAILAADVVGYSRLMGADEEGTLAALKAIRRELVDPTIVEHRGRIVKTTGDGLLVEFASVVDAGRCAVDVQREMAARNAVVPPATRIEFRVGINLGDIIIDGDDIFGDGVNVAARLETLAEPGGIASAAWCATRCATSSPSRSRTWASSRSKTSPARCGSIGYDLKAPSLALPRLRGEGSTRSARVGAADPSVLPLPDKPSIAVLPFANMSGDPEQEYFADGMVEEIITALSRIRWLFVIARNSSFTYKGQAVDVRRVGRELGVRYVLEGSVRKGGGRVRITAQLIEAETGTHLWANRFDGSLEDVFDLQDQVAISVAGVIEPTLRQAEVQRAGRKPTGNLGAYDLYLRALAESEKGEAGLREAVALLKAALAIDPSYATAAARIAYCRIFLQSHGFQVSKEEMAESGELAVQAVRLGNDDPEALSMGGHGAIYFSRAQGIAESASDRAVKFNPNSAWAWAARGYVLVLRNRPELAIDAFQRAMRLSPLDPQTYYFAGGIAFACLYMGRFEEAVEWADRSFDQEPRFTPVLRLKLVACAQLGRIEEARQCLRQVLELQPELTITRLKDFPGMSVTPEILSVWTDGFRKAGLPEE